MWWESERLLAKRELSSPCPTVTDAEEPGRIYLEGSISKGLATLEPGFGMRTSRPLAELDGMVVFSFETNRNDVLVLVGVSRIVRRRRSTKRRRRETAPRRMPAGRRVVVSERFFGAWRESEGRVKGVAYRLHGQSSKLGTRIQGVGKSVRLA